ncbi:hypothetical protein AAVH_04763 [Aphelenchoides avenae]|nr:hypothetical protein AAVH_04763 [Aphelenchus avenae]
MQKGVIQEVLEKLKDGSLHAVDIHIDLDSLEETVRLQLPEDSPRTFSFVHSLDFLQAVMLNEVPHIISDLLPAIPHRIHYQGCIVARLNGAQILLLRPTERSLDVELQSMLRRIRRSHQAEFELLFWKRMRPLAHVRRLQGAWIPFRHKYRIYVKNMLSEKFLRLLSSPDGRYVVGSRLFASCQTASEYSAQKDTALVRRPTTSDKAGSLDPCSSFLRGTATAHSLLGKRMQQSACSSSNGTAATIECLEVSFDIKQFDNNNDDARESTPSTSCSSPIKAVPGVSMDILMLPPPLVPRVGTTRFRVYKSAEDECWILPGEKPSSERTQQNAVVRTSLHSGYFLGPLQRCRDFLANYVRTMLGVGAELVCAKSVGGSSVHLLPDSIRQSVQAASNGSEDYMESEFLVTSSDDDAVTTYTVRLRRRDAIE